MVDVHPYKQNWHIQIDVDVTMDAIWVHHIGFDNPNNYMAHKLICRYKHNQSSYKWQLVA
jgi:hypothetical protein